MAVRMGLTGGIGAGKSTVARMLGGLGAVVVDADAVAREVVERGQPGFNAVVAEFGDAVVRPDGSLDRQALAELVFTDPERRSRLEAIVHPLVAARAEEFMASAPAGSLVVYDVPLLVERDLVDAFDLVVVVEAPEETRIRRLVERGLSPEEARRRIAAQASSADRLAVADVVLDNGGSRASLDAQVAELWEEIVDRLA